MPFPPWPWGAVEEVVESDLTVEEYLVSEPSRYGKVQGAGRGTVEEAEDGATIGAGRASIGWSGDHVASEEIDYGEDKNDSVLRVLVE